MCESAQDPTGGRPGTVLRRSPSPLVDGRTATRAALVTLGTVVALGVDVRLAVVVAAAGAAKVMLMPRSELVPLRSVLGL